LAGPLIPYIEAPELPLSFLEYLPIIGNYIDAADPPSIKPFGTLVALGVYIGSLITMARVKERGLDEKQVSDFIFWVVAFGFVLSHVFDAIAYHPETVMRDPLYLLRVWDGLSSYGGLIGAYIGALAWKHYRKQNITEYIDVTVSAFPTAWVFGRSGCSVVHDHPGALSNAWYAVQYPAHTLQQGFDGRFDLGLMEMVLTIPLAVTCHILWRRQPLRANGFYVGLTLTAYAPVRFLLDFLRVQPGDQIFRGAVDPRYLGLTPAQWVCFLALAVGLLMLKVTWKKPYVRVGALAPDEDEGDLEDKELEDEDEEERLAEERRERRRKRAKKTAGGAKKDGEAPDKKRSKKKKTRKKKRPRPVGTPSEDDAAPSSG
jgi:phosphatidylglycerol:prolipoprotein diacylglycerol transferase